MAKTASIGVNNTPKKVKTLYIGVDNVPKKVKKAWIGVDGVPKLWWEGIDSSKVYEDENLIVYTSSTTVEAQTNIFILNRESREWTYYYNYSTPGNSKYVYSNGISYIQGKYYSVDNKTNSYSHTSATIRYTNSLANGSIWTAKVLSYPSSNFLAATPIIYDNKIFIYSTYNYGYPNVTLTIIDLLTFNTLGEVKYTHNSSSIPSNNFVCTGIQKDKDGNYLLVGRAVLTLSSDFKTLTVKDAGSSSNTFSGYVPAGYYPNINYLYVTGINSSTYSSSSIKRKINYDSISTSISSKEPAYWQTASWSDYGGDSGYTVALRHCFEGYYYYYSNYHSSSYCVQYNYNTADINDFAPTIHTRVPNSSYNVIAASSKEIGVLSGSSIILTNVNNGVQISYSLPPKTFSGSNTIYTLLQCRPYPFDI